MTSRTMASNNGAGDREPGTRIWRLQYGPCWCMSVPVETSSFDYVRMARTAADLGSLDENLLIVSERVIDGTSQIYRRVHSEVPDPKIVISAGTCPMAHRFWSELPNGWVPVQEVLPIDVHVDECINRSPETLLAAVLGYVMSRQAPMREQASSAESVSLTPSMEFGDA